MKVIGYFTSWNDELNEDNINYHYLTHINYAFLIPKEDGSLVKLNYEKINKLISFSHKNNVKVFISIGGWSYENKKLDVVFEKICDKKEIIDIFIKNVMNIVDEFNFDGIDLDWEFPSEKYSSKYEYMVENFKCKLNACNKQLSIAIPPGINVDGRISNILAITDKVLNAVDWINLMVYDNSSEDNHSSYNYAKISIDYWLKQRKYLCNKIVLGLPFYSRPNGLMYRDILNCNKNNYFKDYYDGEFYNGKLTLLKKLELVEKTNCAGVMIWAVNYDTNDEYSLLKVIGDAKEN